MPRPYNRGCEAYFRNKQFQCHFRSATRNRQQKVLLTSGHSSLLFLRFVCRQGEREMAEINVALLGYKFMGKAHSNAYRQLPHFFPCKLEPRMKVICGRDRAALEGAKEQFGWEEIETDWRKVVEREDIQVVDISTPGNLHHDMA